MPRYKDYKDVPANEVLTDKQKQEIQEHQEDEMQKRLKAKINQYNFLQDLFAQTTQQQFKPITSPQQPRIELIDPYAAILR